MPSAGINGFYPSMEGVKECTNDVCGVRHLGGQRRKGSEEVCVVVAEKRRVFEE